MLRNVRVKTHLFPSLILVVAAVVSAVCSPDVMENSSQFSCCNLELKFDQHHENTWTTNNTPIAHFRGDEQSCIHPCEKIEGGVMKLEKCVDVNHTVVSTNEKRVTVEERIYFSAQPCPSSLSDKMAPGNQGSVSLLLLAVLVSGWFVNQMTS